MREKDTIQTKNTLSQTAKLGLNGIVNIPNICNRGRVIPGRVQIIKRLKYEGVEIGWHLWLYIWSNKIENEYQAEVPEKSLSLSL